MGENKRGNILLYIKRDDIYRYIDPYHFTDDTALTLTRLKDVQLKRFDCFERFNGPRISMKNKKIGQGIGVLVPRLYLW